jgi:hypothetical protein
VKNCGGAPQSGTSGTILSPNYPATYGNNLYCEWYIASPAGTTITLNITSFNIEAPFDRLFLYKPPSCISAAPNSNGFLTGTFGSSIIPINQNTLLIAFYSDAALAAGSFRISWTAK